MIRFTIVAILLAVSFLCLTVSGAFAHSWYQERRDPIFNSTSCCGGRDCAPLPPHAISYPNGELRVTLTLEEAQRINPLREEPFDEIIPFDRIQIVSPEGSSGPHICLMNRNRDREGDKRQGFYCIFLPPNG